MFHNDFLPFSSSISFLIFAVILASNCFASISSQYANNHTHNQEIFSPQNQQTSENTKSLEHRKTISTRFPHLSSTFVNNISETIIESSNGVDFPLASSECFVQNFKKNFSSFTRTQVFYKEFHRIALKSLEKMFKEDAVIEVFQDFKENFPHFDIELIFDEVKMKNSIKQFLTQRRNDEFKSLKSKLENWFPESFEFNNQILDYMWDNKLDYLTFKFLSTDKKLFPLKIDQFLIYFRKDFREDFEDKIFDQIEKNLIQIDRENFKEYFGELQKLHVEERFTTKMVYDSKERYHFIRSELQTLYQKCLRKIKAKIEISKDYEELRRKFRENDCISKEICNRKFVFDDEFLTAQLNLYKEYSDQSATTEGNDTLHYDAIRKIILKNKRFDEKKANCFVNFIKRKNSINDSYTPVIRSDQNKLIEKISLDVDEYEMFANGVFFKFLKN